jgi:hypothetical protein
MAMATELTTWLKKTIKMDCHQFRPHPIMTEPRVQLSIDRLK